MANLRRTEAARLELYNTALENAKSQETIAIEMAALNYDSSKIEEGRNLLQTTREVYKLKFQEDAEITEASIEFKRRKELLDELYSKHRKKAKALFRKRPEILKKLAVDGRMPESHTKKMEVIRTFYSITDSNILSTLATLHVTAKEMTVGMQHLEEVEKARAIYLLEVGETEETTKHKDQVLARMEDWMRDFYSIADIALENHPHLIEFLHN